MVKAEGSWFKDEFGRILILRGVNLGGSSKVPLKPDGATHVREGFFDHRNVSFVGRPFPLSEAEEHFSRLKAWGLTFLRLVVTWEAIEHAGPGIYDEAYLDYLVAVVEKAAEYGINLFIDPHQDVWSRFSGGDGAPGWTFEVVGLDIRRFAETGAALIHNLHGDPFPHLIWPTNATKLAAGTMFTLFFGGNDFAPAATIEGEPVQEYLQRHYIVAIGQLAKRLKGRPNVVGYEVMNEPSAGFIGLPDLNQPGGLLGLGQRPSPYQAMLLGAGYPQEVEVWQRGLFFPKRLDRRLINADRTRVWLEGMDCLWRQHGVWDIDASGNPSLLQTGYFRAIHGRAVDFGRDYYRPFAKRFALEIRKIDPNALIFIHLEPDRQPPGWTQDDAQNIVYSPHWYDVFVLFLRRYSKWFAADMRKPRLLIGPGHIRKAFASQLAKFKSEAVSLLGGVPTLIGECGIPFDLDNKRAYQSGNFSKQIAAMDRSLRAIEENLLSCTIWNYTADNINERGDRWNGEDLSIFSRDQQRDTQDINSGGRALEAVVRPYAPKVGGEPLSMSFNYRSKLFVFEFRPDPAVSAPTEIFVPNYQYPQGYLVEVSDGRYDIDTQAQRVLYWPWNQKGSHTHTIQIKARP